MKSQAVRVFDVVALGPFLMWVGTREELSLRARTFFMLSGVATVGFNARFHRELEELGYVAELSTIGQAARLFDIFALGPAMMAASRVEALPPLPRIVLGVGGALTVVNNAANYIEVARGV